MRLTHRRLWVLVIVGFLIGSAPILALTFTNGVQFEQGVTVRATDGPAVTVADATQQEVNGTSLFDGPNTVNLETSEGNITISAQGHSEVQVDEINGTWTNVSNLNVTTYRTTINPEDKQKIEVEGQLDNVSFTAMAIGDGSVDFVFGGSGTIIIYGLQPNTQVNAVDSNNNVVGSNTTTTSGKLVMDIQGSTKTVTLKESKGGPDADNPQPADGAELDYPPTELAVDVTDPDFPDDNVTVEFYLDGTKIGQNSTASNGTVSLNVSSVTFGGGEHNWSVVVTDEIGNTYDAPTWQFYVPSKLFIRNETSPSKLINGSINVTITFFSTGEVVTRNATDGTLNLTGLPVDTPFVVEFDASSDYYERTVYFTTIYEQQNIFLLAKNQTAVETRFTLDDATGRFTSESVLIIQKPITLNNSTKFRTIHSDKFGAEGVTADLDKGERYRILVRSQDGVVQVIGPYRADASETVTVQPGSPGVNLPSEQDGWVAEAVMRNTSGSNATIEWVYDDPNNRTQELKIYIHEKGNTSNLLQPNATYNDLGSVSEIIDLTPNESKKTWVVNFIISFESGKTLTVSKEVSLRPSLVPEMDDVWILIAGVSLLMITAGVFSQLNAAIGGVVTALLGGFLWWAGWLPGATTAAGITIALFVALLVQIYQTRGV